MSLVDVSIVVALTAVLGAMAVPWFSKQSASGALRRRAALLVSDLREARSLAGSGQENDAWPAGSRTKSAGLRFVGDTAYELFIDRDRAPGDEIVIRRVDYGAELPELDLRLAADAPELRFRPDGTLSAGEDARVELRDLDSQRRRVVRVTLGGATDVAL